MCEQAILRTGVNRRIGQSFYVTSHFLMTDRNI